VPDTFTVVLSEEAFAVVCGLVQPSSDVNPIGIFADEPVWHELRDKFPLANFDAAASASIINYDEEAGE
jgi:hypothetical protein